MEVLHPYCAGLDVHKKTVVACAITPAGRELRTFGTLTAELLELSAWLAARGVTDVAMESTGSFWKPVYNVLEGRFTLLVANARHIKAVPGRKTDVRDAEWIAELLRHGLIRASFVPERAERELRELVRYRASLVRERTNELNRIAKVLEGANLKLASVASIGGASSRAILAALVAGETDAAAMAELARGRLREKRAALAAALTGSIGAHQRFVLGVMLRHLGELDQRIDEVSAEIAARLQPKQAQLVALESIPGIGRRLAEVVIAEVGADMTRFPSARHLASSGRHVPGQRRVSGQASLRADQEGQPLAPRRSRGGRPCGGADADLSGGAVPPPRRATGHEARRGRRRPYHPRRRLPPARRSGRPLPRPRPRLLRPARPRTRHPPARAPHRGPRLPGRPVTRQRVSRYSRGTPSVGT
jgi:transposase